MTYLRSPAVVSFEEFRARLTEGERGAMYGAMSGSPAIADFVSRSVARNTVDLSDAGAKAAFVAASVLDAGRAGEVFMA